MLITVLGTIAKVWNQPRYPSTDDWIKKLLYVYTMARCLAMKCNEILTFVVNFMELEIIVLNEISQTERQVLVNLYLER